MIWKFSVIYFPIILNMLVLSCWVVYDFYVPLFSLFTFTNFVIKNNFQSFYLYVIKFFIKNWKKHKIIKCERSNLITHGKRPIVESIVSVSFEEIRVTTVNYRGIKIIGESFPIRDQFGISVLHRWFLGWVEPPEFATFVEIEFAISGPNGHSVDIIRNSCKTFADFFRIVSIHFFAHVSPIFRALQQISFISSFILYSRYYRFILALISRYNRDII